MLIPPQVPYRKLVASGKYNQLIEIIEQNPKKSKFTEVLRTYCYAKIGKRNVVKRIRPVVLLRADFTSDEEYFAVNVLYLDILLQLNLLDEFEKLKSQFEDTFSGVDLSVSPLYELVRQNLTYLEAKYHYLNLDNKKSIGLLQNLKDEVSDEVFLSSIYNLLGASYRKIANLDEAVQYYNLALDLRNQQPNISHKAITLNHLGILYASRNQYGRAKDYFEEILDLGAGLEDEVIKAKVYNNLGIINRHEGRMQTALEYYDKARVVYENLENFRDLQIYHINVGNIRKDQSKFNEALQHYRRALSLNNHVRDNETYVSIIFSIGTVHKKLGNFKQAEYHYNLSLEKAKEQNNIAFIAKIQNNIAVINNNQGKISEALDKFKEVLKLTKNMNDIILESQVLTNLGISYNKLHQYKKAKKYLDRSYKIKKSLANSNEMAITLFHLVQIEIHFENIRSAKQYLKEFEQLLDQTENVEVISRYNMAKASILQLSDNNDDQLLASQLIEDALSGDYINFEINIFALIAFCEYLIMELQNTNSEEILYTLDTTVETLYNLANDNESHELIAKTLIIQAKISLLKFQTNEAIYYLNQAQNIADSHNLEEVRLKISFIETQVQNSLYDITEKLYKETDYQERIEELEIIDYVRNLYYQKQANEILRSDLHNIRRFNDDLANMIQLNDNIPINLENLANIIDLTSREINIISHSLMIIEKIEKENFIININEINPKVILEDLISIYQTSISSNYNELVVHPFPEETIIQDDPQLFEKILDHVFLNALKFTPKGGTIELLMEQLSDEEVVISLKNDCDSIPEEIIPKLRKKYFQYAPDDRLVKGYGVGLTFIDLSMDLLGHDYRIISPLEDQDQGFEIRLHFKNTKL